MSRSSTPSYQIRRPGISTSLNQSSAAASASTSRANTPLGRTVISLEEWESKAPLSDEQLSTIGLVKDRYSERPLPEKVSDSAIRAAKETAY